VSTAPRLALLLCAALPFTTLHAQTAPPQGAVTAPLVDVPVHVREQPLSTGKVTHATQILMPSDQAQVTVRSIQPDSVIGNYRIDFDAMDVDGDGFISREEAQANPALADEFNALDSGRRGKLSRAQLAGWLR